jgi:hypothetical protein
MGMYDHVHVEHESMPAEWRAHEFQTKDLGEGVSGSLDTFTITADGRLTGPDGDDYPALPDVEWQIEFYDFENSGDYLRDLPLMYFIAKFKGRQLAGPIAGPFTEVQLVTGDED